MSTRCLIGISRRGGKIETVYVHHDGYPEYVGKILLNKYKDHKTVNKLMKVGDMSILGLHPVSHGWHENLNDIKYASVPWSNYELNLYCESYKDRGDDNVDSKMYNSIEDFCEGARNCWADYCYVYKNKKWHMVRDFTLVPLLEYV